MKVKLYMVIWDFEKYYNSMPLMYISLLIKGLFDELIHTCKLYPKLPD